MRIAIVVGSKGRGSNMSAIVDAWKGGNIPADEVTVVAPSAESPAAQLASDKGVSVRVIDPQTGLLQFVEDERIDLICLAGYMKKLPADVVSALRNRIVNIHPALLPKHGGQGMYGMRVHESVLSSGDRESGCTVHFVTEEYDEGDPLLQLRCEVREDDTPETLAARVLELEHQAFPEAIRIWIHRYGQPGRNASL
ncbi:MAG: phosphoribosylglycinamide formyltransferase [Armatimonadetes bacterium]|nr:phosphoribosylglycinamide formyltransferase [Armatimonadota bacterium]